MLLALALSLSLAPAAAPAGVPSAGAVVARVEVVAPEAESFVLHATVPLPPGELAGELTSSGFALRSHDAAGTLVPAQLAGVSRYPGGDWDVVQVIGRVARGADEAAGDPLRYELVRAEPAPQQAHKPSALLAGLLARKHALVLRARDVYGHAYEMDLLALPKGPGTPAWRMRKQGPWLNQFRTAGALLPREDEYSARRAGPPLPHLMGALAWFSDWEGEACVQLDLRVHNGLTSGALKAAPGEEPVGAVYWQSLELVVPAGVAVVPNVADPFFGEPWREGESLVWPIVAAYPDGELHLMPPQAQLVRRLALVRAGDEALARARLDHAGLGFCALDAELWSWGNPRTARYFPQRDLLPSYDVFRWRQLGGRTGLRAFEALRLGDLRAALERGAGGAYPAKSPNLGWAHPWFLSIEAGTGGEEIALLEGQQVAGGASREAYACLELLHRRNVDRQPQALWGAHGEVRGLDAWTVNGKQGPRVPFDFRTNARATVPTMKLPALGGPPANAQVAEVAARGARPPYDGGTPFERGGVVPRDDAFLVSWLPHDGQHWVRFTKNAKALLWLGDDALAEDDLELCAELFRLYFHELDSPHPAGAEVTLAHFERVAREHPHQGLPLSRDHAWGLDAFCAYYSTADDAWRARELPWASRVADLMVAGAMPSGLLIRSDYPPLLDDARYEGAHAFQSEFLMLAQRSLVASVFAGVDDERAAQLAGLYVRAVDYLFWGPVWQRERDPYAGGDAPVWLQGPRWAFPVALNDDYALPPFSDTRYWGADYLPQHGFKGAVETSYGYSSLAFAADWTRDSAGPGASNRYLRRALDYGRGAANWDELAERLTLRMRELGPEALRDSAGFLARLQLLRAARR